MPTPRPFRLRVLDALTARLAAVSTTDGFTSDLVGRVFRGRAAYGENDPLPMVSIIEDPRNVDPTMAPAQSSDSTVEWQILIQGFVEDDFVHPTDPAYFLACDVKRALVEARAVKRDIFGLGYKLNSVQDIRIGNPIVRPADEISAKAYFWLPVTLCLMEDHEHPFT